jgi:hypothetical protein
MLVRPGFEEARQLREVAPDSDEAHLGLEIRRIDELGERYVAKVELPAHADHVSVEALLDKGAVRTDAKLAPEHDVERVGR